MVSTHSMMEYQLEMVRKSPSREMRIPTPARTK
jgi:hypothetical protein